MGWTALVVDADGHGAIQTVVFEIVVGAAALGALCRVHETVKPNVTNGLIFSLRDLVGLLLFKAMFVELAEGAVELGQSLSKESGLSPLLVVVGPTCLIRIE